MKLLGPKIHRHSKESPRGRQDNGFVNYNIRAVKPETIPICQFIL